ncbi:MAG: thiamine-binding protein [Anaerolineae bacterium]
MSDQNHTVTVGVEVLPFCDDPYPVVDQAIAAIRATGIKHEVTPLETVIEGTMDECLAAAKAAHQACLNAGVSKVLTLLKISDGLDGSTIDDKMAKYR